MTSKISKSSKITIAQFTDIIETQLPFACLFDYQISRLEAGQATITFIRDDKFIRPGGTVAGPVQMLLADLTMYAVVLSLIGPVELAVTTSLNCNFLRRPKLADLRADGRILKLGKRLAVGEISLFSSGDDQPVAHATCTYSIPPQS